MSYSHSSLNLIQSFQVDWLAYKHLVSFENGSSAHCFHKLAIHVSAIDSANARTSKSSLSRNVIAPKSIWPPILHARSFRILSTSSCLSKSKSLFSHTKLFTHTNRLSIWTITSHSHYTLGFGLSNYRFIDLSVKRICDPRFNMIRALI